MEPNANSRICSCHFREGKKENGPEIYLRNEAKLFPAEDTTPRRKIPKLPPPPDIVVEMDSTAPDPTAESVPVPEPESERVLKEKLKAATEEAEELRKQLQHTKRAYTYNNLTTGVLQMETGLPTKELFDTLVAYVN